MGRLKNIRLNKLFSLCLISCLAFNIVSVRAYSESDNYVISDSEAIIENISDINNIDNLGNIYTINAKTICVHDEYILVNDGTGEIWVFLDGISVDNIQNEDDIFVTGTLIQINDKILISVNDINNIGLIVNDEEPSEEPTVPDDSETPKVEEDSNKPNDNTGGSSGTTSKPSDTSDKPGSSSSGSSSSTTKPSGSSGNSTGTSDKTSSGSSSEYTGPIIKANTPIEITYDLSSSQWDEIKSAYESGYIKIKDLDNNKLRITKVSKEYGDTIWIVNDPRMLDSEENKIFTIGSSLLETIDYNNYDISESSWNAVINDISNGIAKMKLLENDVLEVIYPSSEVNDSIMTINKK